MAIKYRIVDISTLKGLKRAEWYKAHGWIIESVGFNTIQFYKKSLRETVKKYYCQNCEAVYYRKEELHSCPVCGNKLQ